MSASDQSAYGVRFEWGESGLPALAATSDVLVIVNSAFRAYGWTV